MIKKIDRYIARKFVLTLVFILVLFSLIAVVFDASERMDKYLGAGVPFKDLLAYYLGSFVPYLLNLISPIFIFIAALFFTSRMAYNSEIVTIFSSGVSFWRLLRPYLLVATVITLIDLNFKNYVIPVSNKKMADFESKYLRRGGYDPNVNIHRQLDEGVFFSLDRYHYSDSMGTRFSMERFDGLDLKEKILATHLKWAPKRRQWYAHEYVRRLFGENGQTLETGDTLWIDLPIMPKQFTKQIESVTSMKTPDLVRFIAEERKSGNPDLRFFQVEHYQRYSIPFASYILIMIAYALASRKVRGGTGMHLMLGILIAVSYILFMRFTLTFGQQSTLNPLAAVWIPNVFFFVVAVVLMARAPK
ncbi:MAG: LptF/LptG family permease [Bacteroidetes bacterium]|nr:LptF/LptG family permease [Bacteroidota bacterium]